MNTQRELEERYLLSFADKEDPDNDALSAFRREAAKHVSPEIVSHREMCRQILDPWMEEPEIPWEQEFLIDPFLARRALFEAWFEHSADPGVWTAMKGLWKKQRFEAVVTDMVVLHTIPVRVHHTLSHRAEQDPYSKTSDVGRTSLPRVFLPRNWGPHMGDLHAVRGKLNGVMFTKVQEGKKFFLRGSFDIEVPADFVVEKAEMFGSKFYILWPYACASFKFSSSEEVFFFEDHPWQHPSDFEDHASYDGLMVLTYEGEFRAKRIPTVEVEYQGVVWETAFLKTEGESRREFLRPRPGKIPSSTPFRVLSQVTMQEIQLTFPQQALYSIKEVTQGATLVNYSSTRDGAFIIDHGCRMDEDGKIPRTHEFLKFQRIEGLEVYDLLPSQGFAVVRSEQSRLDGIVRSPSEDLGNARVMSSYIGSKGLLIYEHKQKVGLIRDNGKPLDMLGGGRRMSENPADTFVREAREELNKQFSPEDLVYLGPSEEVDKNVTALSYVFLVNCTEELKGIEWFDFKELRSVQGFLGSQGNVQPWLSRLLMFVEARIGTWGKIFEIARRQIEVECRETPRVPPQYQSWTTRNGEVHKVKRLRPCLITEPWQKALVEVLASRDGTSIMNLLKDKPKVLYACFAFSWRHTNLSCDHTLCDCTFYVTGLSLLKKYSYEERDRQSTIQARLNRLLDSIEKSSIVIGGRLEFRA